MASSQTHSALTNNFQCTLASRIITGAPKSHPLSIHHPSKYLQFRCAGERLNLKGHAEVLHYMPKEFYNHYSYRSGQISYQILTEGVMHSKLS